jgi:preprotein translocase subunit SecF
MMTKLNISSKRHLFIIISIVLIAIGMAVGTVCHFVSNGFFNYGSEFSSYKSVTVSYLAAEQTEDSVKDICEIAFSDLHPVEVSYAEVSTGGEVVYKFSQKTDTASLERATEQINLKLSANSGLSTASLHDATTFVGGSRVLIYTSIALASAAVFQCLYFLLRYKLRAALSALATSVTGLGLFAAFVAMTRIPVGIEVVALGALVVVVTLATCGLYFSHVNANKKDVNYGKTAISEISDISAGESASINIVLLLFLIIAIVLTAIFAVISATAVTVLAPYAVAVLAIVVSGYASLIFAPSVYSAMMNISKNTNKNLANKKAKK